MTLNLKLNPGMLKRKLLQIQKVSEDFTIEYEGKHKTIDGLYRPETCTIVIYDENHVDDNGIIYTALHELAHHVDITTSIKPRKKQLHNTRFKSIFYGMLNDAERKKLYINPYENNPMFLNMKFKLDDLMTSIGDAKKRMGVLLQEVYELCVDNNMPFDDFMERQMQIDMKKAQHLLMLPSLSITVSKVCFDNHKILCSAKDERKRKKALVLLENDKSPAIVKETVKENDDPATTLDYLRKEREKLINELDRKSAKLEEIEAAITNEKRIEEEEL